MLLSLLLLLLFFLSNWVDIACRLNGLQTQPHRKNADGSGEISAKEQSKPENRRKPPDLRKKLEVRGLYRKRQLARNGEAEKPAQADMDSNNNSVRRHAGDKRVSKIYVKPSLIAQANAPDNSASAKVPRAEETDNIVITRYLCKSACICVRTS